MGYETEFEGYMVISPPLSKEDFDYLEEFHLTRHYQRDVHEKYGELGEFYVDKEDTLSSPLFFGKDAPQAIDYNTPPPSQPSLWCGWYPCPNNMSHLYCEDGKSYCYTEWLIYLIDKILAPRGYTVNGRVYYRGEDFGDMGVIEARDNKVKQLPATLTEW